jgi:coenzyme F420 hydrogenase subunit beta
MNNTIRNVVESKLCSGCGTCFSMCPKSAITLKMDEREWIYLPKIDESKCNHCGVCFHICPGRSIDFGQKGFKATGNKWENLIGRYLHCYIGYSNDQEIRYDSSSGGLVTQILIFALERGIIDGAVVTRMRKDKPLEAEPFLARTKKEIRSASKSKYCPVPVNMVLSEVIKQKGKFAVVGLPCHISGIRNAEIYNKTLKAKIVLHLGLFCSHTVNFLGTKFLLERFNIKVQEVKRLDYRGMGWPGSLSILLSDGRRFKVPEPEYWRFFSPYFFAPLRCMFCYDQMNENADLSFGDAWLEDIKKKDSMGSSIIISRNNIGEAVLKEAELAGFITLNKISSDRVVTSQRSSLYFKKYGCKARLELLKHLGLVKTNHSINGYAAHPLSYVISLFQLSDALLSQKRSVYKILKYAPVIWIRGWGALLYYLEHFIYHSSVGR